MPNNPDALEMLRAQNLVYPNLDHIIAALESERRKNDEQDAKIRRFLDPEELAIALIEAGAHFPAHVNAVETVLGCERYAEALALLGGGTK
jgi:hypothetical protein